MGVLLGDQIGRVVSYHAVHLVPYLIQPLPLTRLALYEVRNIKGQPLL